MTRRLAATLLLPLLLGLSACGPILGQAMKVTEGTTVADAGGSAADIRTGSRLAILSPFPKSPDAFYIVKGEDEGRFAEEFNRLGLFRAQVVSGNFPAGPEAGKALGSKLPSDLKREMSLDAEPEILLSGTLLSRKTYVAPARGVVMAVSWRLTFHDLRTGKSWTVDAESKELAEETIPRIVARIGKKLGR